MTKQIKYSSKFKIQAVKQHEQGLTPRTIFKLHGFDLSKISKNIPKYCLARWNKIYREHGEQGLIGENRGKHSKGGGRSKILKFKDEKEKIKYLELQVVYLKAENDFLIKLRAQKKKE
jgi:hypothetical protein